MLAQGKGSQVAIEGTGALGFVAKLDSADDDSTRITAPADDVVALDDGGCVALFNVHGWATQSDVVLGKGRTGEFRIAVGEDASTPVVARYSADGELAWAKGTGGGAFVTSRGMKLLPDRIVVAGLFSGTFSAQTPQGSQSRGDEGELQSVVYTLSL
ncbi:MAG: hypothetical protein ACI9MC_004029 [Kiritimatiellia bacterium]